MSETTYAVFNPNDGLYTKLASFDECLNKVAGNAFILLMAHTHNSPYAIITTDAENNEVWQSLTGELINEPTLSYEQVRTSIEERVKRLIGANPPTPVEQMP